MSSISPSMAAVNPQDILPDGMDEVELTNPYTHETAHARKGTVGALIYNVVYLNEHLGENEQDFDQDITQIEQGFENLADSWNAIGLFDLFDTDEWLQADDQPGRQYAAMIFLSQHPEKCNAKTKAQLEHLCQKSDSKYIRDKAKSLLTLLG